MASKQPALAGALGQASADKRVEILRRVAALGSISQAARAAGVSYKAAWQALDTLSNLAGTPLVERAVGGAGGGGARLTPAGEQVREALNNWIRTGSAFDGVIDFATPVADPANPLTFAAQYNERDKLHPNDAGYQAMANAIDLDMITK